jgi:hypothetical protein
LKGIKIQNSLEEVGKTSDVGTCELFEEREIEGKWYEIFTGIEFTQQKKQQKMNIMNFTNKRF